MDVDLATGLDALLPLVAPLLSGHSDVAIGSRLAPGAHVVRGARRELISRGYNLLLRAALRSPCTDAQCGFKAMRREAATRLLPLVEDQAWFFDTELLITAHRLGLRIHEVPVDWVDDLDSRVQVVRTAWLDLCGMWRVMGRASRRKAATVRAHLPADVELRSPDTMVTAVTPEAASDGLGSATPSSAPGRLGDPVFADDLLRFAGVGAASTLAYVGLFAALEPSLGSYAANLISIAVCSVGNTAAHRGMAGAAQHGLPRSPARPDRRRALRCEPGSHHRRARRHPGRRAHRAPARAGRGHRWPIWRRLPSGSPSSAPWCSGHGSAPVWRR